MVTIYQMITVSYILSYFYKLLRKMPMVIYQVTRLPVTFVLYNVHVTIEVANGYQTVTQYYILSYFDEICLRLPSYITRLPVTFVQHNLHAATIEIMVTKRLL